MRYFTYSNNCIPYHPTLYFYNSLKNENLIINQTMQENIKICEKLKNLKTDEFELIKKKLNLSYQINAIFKNGRAFIISPHLVKDEDVILGDPTNLIRNISHPNNIITCFKFVQTFFINFEMELFRYDPQNGLIVDKNYLNLKDYLIKNADGFKPEVKDSFLKLLEFYEKNKPFLNEHKLSFLELLNKADVEVNVKNFFLKIIENSDT